MAAGLQLQIAQAEIERIKSLLRDQHAELKRLQQLLENEKASGNAARKEVQDLRAEVQDLLKTHGEEIERLLQEISRLKKANQDKVDEANAVFLRQMQDMEQRLASALEAARLLVRYAIPAHSTIRQLSSQKELLSTLAADYYKQVSIPLQPPPPLHTLCACMCVWH